MAQRDERHGRRPDDVGPRDERDLDAREHDFVRPPAEDDARGRDLEPRHPHGDDYGRERAMTREDPYEVDVITDESPGSQQQIRRVRDPETGRWVTSERVRRRQRGPSYWMSRVGEFIDYAFYLLYGLIILEIVLELFGARDQAQFKQFMDTVTAPFLAPFRGIVADPQFGASEIMLSYVVALLFYVLLQMAVRGLLRLFARRNAGL